MAPFALDFSHFLSIPKWHPLLRIFLIFYPSQSGTLCSGISGTLYSGILTVLTTARKTITTAYTHAPRSHTHHREADATNRKRRDSMSGMPNRKTTIGTYHDFLQRTSYRCHATAQSWLTKDKKRTA